MCAMCVVIGSVAVVGGAIAFVMGKISGKPEAENE